MKNKSILHTAFLTIAAFFIAAAASVNSFALSDRNMLISDSFICDDFEIKYRAYIPDDYKDKSYPVVLYLHTVGEIGNDNERQLEYGLPLLLFEYGYIEKYPAIYLFPQSPYGSKWVDVEWDSGVYSTESIAETRAVKAALGLTEYYAESYNGDKDRLYVTGISMGGYGSWDLLARHPGVFAAAIPICGGADPEMAENISKTPVRAYHGDSDDIVPPSGDIAVNKALKEIGADAELILIPGGTHFNIWLDAYIDSLDWMFDQIKNGKTSEIKDDPVETETKATESPETDSTDKSDTDLSKKTLLISVGAIVLFVLCFVIAYKLILYIYTSNRKRNRED
jgi:predicted peptidase